MPPASLIDKIRRLLDSEAHERQIAAAIVLGEIGAAEPAVIDALSRTVQARIPPVKRHALEALGQLVGSKGVSPVLKRTLPTVLAAAAAREEPVRRAAIDAAVAFGSEAVGPVRAHLAEATDPIERRALEEILGRVGGKDAFSALLAALDTTDVEAARAGALAVRQRIKEANPREKTGYLAQVMKLLKGSGGKKKAGPNPALLAGALKIAGYLEDPAAIPTLLAFARDKKQPAPVREEAIVALRFAARGKAGARVGPPLLELAEKGPPELGRTALYTLASLELPSTLAPRLRKLALAGPAEIASVAIERLASLPGSAGGDGLAAVLAATADRARAEAAANALAEREDGAFALGRALLAAPDGERAGLLARLLRPRARSLAASGAAGKKLAGALVADALARIERDLASAESLLPLARELDREGTTAGLRGLAAKLQRRKKPEVALELLRLVGHGTDATPEDGYALATAELAGGRREEALRIVQQLLDRGFDVPTALRKDRQLTPEQRYQIGFNLVERRQPAGEEILAELAHGGSKLAKMARAKLKSAGYG